MTIDQIKAILRLVTFPCYAWNVVGDFEPGNSIPYLQAEFLATCADTGVQSWQKSRKWRLSQHMTRSEIVQTALKCVLTSVEHEAREQFKYRGQAIFGPHFDVEHLVDLCQAKATEVRP